MEARYILIYVEHPSWSELESATATKSAEMSTLLFQEEIVKPFGSPSIL